MGDLLLLESFDRPADRSDPGPGPDWLAGHRAGYDAGWSAALAEQTALRATTAQALADLTLSARDAQNRVLDRLGPLFAAIATQVVPLALHETLGRRLVDMLSAAAAQDARRDIALHVAPDEVAAVAATVAEIAGGGLTVAADPRIGPGQIVIDGGGGETCLDTGRLTRDIAQALAALTDPTSRRTRNG